MKIKAIAFSLLSFFMSAISCTPAFAHHFDWGTFGQQKLILKKIDPETLIIKGNIQDGDHQKFKAIFDRKIKLVRVSGAGGSVVDSAQIGSDLLEQGVDIVVDGPCLSSCANYLFLAGNRKIFVGDGFVAFHGSPWLSNLLSKDRRELYAFVDDGTIPVSMRRKVEEDRKKYSTDMSVEEILEFIGKFQRPALKIERDFFSRVGVNEDMLGHSVAGRFVSELSECQVFVPLSQKEKRREPFLFVTTEQMAAYGVGGLLGQQNWNLAYEMASLVKNNERDDKFSFVFCVDAKDRKDWLKAVPPSGSP